VGRSDSTSLTNLTALSSAQLLQQGSYDGFDFDSIWFLDDIADFKYPQLQSNPHPVPEQALTVIGISVATLPSVQTYSIGEALNLGGLTIAVHYSDGTCNTIATGFEVDYDFSSTGTKTVTVTYEGFTDTFTVNVESAHEHSYILTRTVAPTCADYGQEIYTCACGDSYDEPTERLPHTPTTIIDEDATCTEAGSKHDECEVCFADLDNVQAIPATGHTSGEWEITRAATSTEPGERVKTCTVCGTVLEREAIPATDGGDPPVKKYIFCTKYESTFWNWFKFIVLFGWLWMWFF